MLGHPVNYRGQNLFLEGADLGDIAIHYGTPTYVYSFSRVRDKLRLLRQTFTSSVRVHYALKSNSNPTLLKKLAQEGVGADVVSGGEIHRALTCGFPADQIIFSGVGKSVDEINYALDQRIHVFNVESPQELERIGILAQKKNLRAPVSFRINPNVNPKTHPYITTGFKKNKFGMDKTFLPELLKILKRHTKDLRLIGLDFHIGSQLMELKSFEDATRHSLKIFKDLKSLGHDLRHFDVGGGMGIPYKPGEKVFAISEYGKRLTELLSPLGCEIFCEPGRFLVGDAGVLLTQVEYVKKTPHKTFVIVNTGMHHLLRPSLYGAYHHILPLKKSKKALRKVDVVGPICESGDWLAQDRPMSPVKMGDFLAILDVGAYGFTMASDYNLHARPVEVVID